MTLCLNIDLTNEKGFCSANKPYSNYLRFVQGPAIKAYDMAFLHGSSIPVLFVFFEKVSRRQKINYLPLWSTSK